MKGSFHHLHNVIKLSPRLWMTSGHKTLTLLVYCNCSLCNHLVSNPNYHSIDTSIKGCRYFFLCFSYSDRPIKFAPTLIKKTCFLFAVPTDPPISHQPCNKLELCAFAIKGEHNVYSLVPNMYSCLYVYIYWPKVNLNHVVVGQQSVRTLFKSLAQLFL